MSIHATVLYRGIRTWEKDGKEERDLHILNSWGPLVFGPLKWPLKTWFLEGDKRYLHLSSTLIRNACLECKTKEGGGEGEGKEKNLSPSLSGMVPKEVEEDIVKAYA